MLDIQNTKFTADDFMVTEQGEYFLYEVNHDTFGRTGSEVLFHQHFGNLFRKEALYLILGSDSGLLINFLYKQELPEATRYLFIEPDTVIDAIQGRPGAPAPEDQPQDRIFLTTAQRVPLAISPDLWQRYLLRNQIYLLKSIAAEDAHLEIYASMWREMRTFVSAQTWAVQVRANMFIHRTVQLFNLADNLSPAARLAGCLHGMTAVVAAGGPSLAGFLPWIKEHRERIALVAVSRVAGVLSKEDIIPDVVVTLDPFESSYQVSYDMLRLGERTLLVNGHHAYSALVEGWSGPKCYIGTLFPWQSKGNLNNFPQWGPTVTNDALFIALEFGCNIVILAGVDLCFSPEGRTHTTGTPEGDLGPRLMQGDTFVTTNDGTVTETDHEYLRAADNINGMATLAHKRGQRVVNPSGQAVKLSQVEHISLADLETPESVLDAWSRICSLLPRHDREAQRHHCRVVERELLKATAEVRHIRGLAAEALECNRKLHGKEGKDPGSIQSVRIEKIERKIARHKVFEPFLKTFGLRQFYQTIRIDKDDEWSEQDKDEYAIGYYEAYTKTADVVLTILGFALKRLRTREEEIKEAPNMDLLLEYWGSDEARELNQDGQLAEAEKRIFLDVLTRSRFMHLRARPRAWQALRPDVVVRLSAANRVDLEALMAQQERRAEEFIQTLRNDLTKELALDKLGGRALEYFVNRDQDGLQRLQCGLGIHPHAEEAGQYLHLVEGYLAELAKEPEKAAGHYVEVHLPVIREAALKRRLYLLLGREELEESLTVLEELIRLSPFYLPHYADLLRITGKVQRAIDVFTGYLQNCPFDLYSMMKLGMLYYQIGANESAEWVMRHVLSRQPRNQVATEILERLTRAEEGPVDAGAAAS